jgi:hypothetical protein
MQSIFQTTFAPLPSDLPANQNLCAAPVSFNDGSKPVGDDAFQMLVNISAAEYKQKYKDSEILNDGLSGEGSSSNVP